MILKKTPIIKRQIIIWTIGSSPLNLTPFDLLFKALISAVVALSIGTPSSNSVGVYGESRDNRK
jgi:hypothetical protein